MGISLRTFLFNDNDTIERLPLTSYERLLRRHPEECLPKYTGQRVRFTEVAVELKERKPRGFAAAELFVKEP
jgi:hypothetical protein